MNTNLSTLELRCWAEQCNRYSKDPMITGEEYERLVKMRDGLLAVAETKEGLKARAIDVAA